MENKTGPAFIPVHVYYVLSLTPNSSWDTQLSHWTVESTCHWQALRLDPQLTANLSRISSLYLFNHNSFYTVCLQHNRTSNSHSSVSVVNLLRWQCDNPSTLPQPPLSCPERDSGSWRNYTPWASFFSKHFLYTHSCRLWTSNIRTASCETLCLCPVCTVTWILLPAFTGHHRKSSQNAQILSIIMYCILYVWHSMSNL